MTRIIAKIFAVTFFLTTFLHVGSLFAAPVVWISSTGTNSNCSAAQPCANFIQALMQVDSGGQINCLDSPGFVHASFGTMASFTLDCAGVFGTSAPNAELLLLGGVNQVVKIRNLTMSGAAGGFPAIKVTGSGTLILENCVFENFLGTALDIEPDGPLNLVITKAGYQTILLPAC